MGKYTCVALVILAITLFATACNAELGNTGQATTTPTATATVGNCRIPDDGIIPRPPVTPLANPDMATVTSTPFVISGTITPTSTPTNTPLPWCPPTPTLIPQTPYPTPMPTATSSFSAPIQRELTGGSGGGSMAGNSITTVTDGSGIDSLTLDIADQTVTGVAAGPQQTMIFWTESENLVATVTQKLGIGQQVTQIIGPGRDVAAVYSKAGRLHMVYERDGVLYYRFTDDEHIAFAEEIRLTAGASPSITVDNEGWPRVAFVAGGSVYHIPRNNQGWVTPERIASGESVSLVATDDEGVLAAVRNGSSVRVYFSRGEGWSEQVSFPADGIIGNPRLDVSGDLAYVAWITELPDPSPQNWPRRRPEYKGAAPFVNRIYSGDNAQQYFTTFGIHDAGVYQTFSTAQGTNLTVSAQYMGWSCGEPSVCSSALPNEPNPPSGSGANMQAQICIDPTGGVDIYSPTVVCSAPNNTLDSWVTLSVSTVAQAGQATIFLRTAPDLPRKTQDVYWDNVQLVGGSLINPNFEGDYTAWNSVQELKVAEGWTPFYTEDPPAGSGTGLYEVWTAWSTDGGVTWSNAIVVTNNTTSSRERDGAFRPDVYPLTFPHKGYVAFVFLFMDGNPTREGMKRYGRPALAACELRKDNCAGFWRIFPERENRPAANLMAATSPDTRRYTIVAWDAYQSSSAKGKDVFSSILAP